VHRMVELVVLEEVVMMGVMVMVMVMAMAMMVTLLLRNEQTTKCDLD
jgi:hypothetical protein